jgi:hypothetical protein
MKETYTFEKGAGTFRETGLDSTADLAAMYPGWIITPLFDCHPREREYITSGTGPLDIVVCGRLSESILESDARLSAGGHSITRLSGYGKYWQEDDDTLVAVIVEDPDGSACLARIHGLDVEDVPWQDREVTFVLDDAAMLQDQRIDAIGLSRALRARGAAVRFVHIEGDTKTRGALRHAGEYRDPEAMLEVAS